MENRNNDLLLSDIPTGETAVITNIYTTLIAWLMAFTTYQVGSIFIH